MSFREDLIKLSFSTQSSIRSCYQEFSTQVVEKWNEMRLKTQAQCQILHKSLRSLNVIEFKIKTQIHAAQTGWRLNRSNQGNTDRYVSEKEKQQVSTLVFIEQIWKQVWSSLACSLRCSTCSTTWIDNLTRSFSTIYVNCKFPNERTAEFINRMWQAWLYL